MTEKQIYVGIGVAGLGVIGVIIYKSLKKPQQDYDKLVGEKTPTPTQPQYNTPQYVAQANNSSSDTWKIQQALKDGGYDISVDGIWGKQTETIFKQWRNDIGKSGSTYDSWTSGQWVDYLNKEKNSYGGGNQSSSSSQTNTSIANMSNNQLIAYIKSKTISLNTDLGSWYGGALKEWAKALSENKSTFYCSQCWTKVNYDTQTGMRLN